MKKILAIVVLCISLFGSEEENIFWNDVKNTNDLELLQLYKEKYPNGIYKSIADLKIRRLQESNTKQQFLKKIPTWIRGYTSEYQYYSVAKANQHFKGEEYQLSLVQTRAERKLINLLVEANFSTKKIQQLMSKTHFVTYKDKNNRIYMLLFIDNYNL